jgi:hypothetical protein
MSHQRLDLIDPSDERGRSLGMGGRGELSVDDGGRSWATLPRGLDESAAIDLSEVERLSEQGHGVSARAVRHPALYIADTPPADGGLLC